MTKTVAMRWKRNKIKFNYSKAAIVIDTANAKRVKYGSLSVLSQVQGIKARPHTSPATARTRLR